MLNTPTTTYLLSVFIEEITARAFIVADSNKRRTLSRSDIAKALGKSDQFDFLIDIVPRELGMPSLPSHVPGGSGEGKRTAVVHANVGQSSGGAGGVVKHSEVRPSQLVAFWIRS